MLFPSACGGGFAACALGYDFFNDQVEVRAVAGPGASPQVFASARLSTGLPSAFDVPAGLLNPGEDYPIEIRLVHDELEAFLPGSRFFRPIENRSTAYVAYTAPIPEPQSCAMLLAGLGLIGFLAARRAPRR